MAYILALSAVNVRIQPRIPAEPGLEEAFLLTMESNLSPGELMPV